MKLSVSQHNQYNRCAYSWFLSRRLRAWNRPAAWLPQGSAVHTVIEHIEKSGRTMTLDEAQDLFREEYAKEVDRYTNGEVNDEGVQTRVPTPNFAYWSRSGPYAGEQDVERRYGIGLEQVARYFAWIDKNPNIVPWRTPEDKLAIELGFDIDLDGVLIRGFIDAVMIDTNTGEIIVDDAKTGNKPPDESIQLGTYKVAVEELFGLPDIRTGVYWMGKTGKFTKPYDISGWTRDRVRDAFKELQDNIEAERFEPDPEPSKCMFCDVSNACEFRM